MSADIVLARIDFELDGPGDAVRTAGHRLTDPAAAQLRVDDLAATRGDGVFETFSVGRGRPQALLPHLERFERSAALLDLPAPDLDAWRAAVLDVAERLSSHPEAWIKIVLTRGIEGGELPTGWAYGTVSGDFSAQRESGIRIVLLDRGYRHDVAQTSRWLLAGAKTLSYAINRAAQREAARRGADDALFLSSDGYLLEGPVSNLVLRHGRRLTTPRTDLGILAGTTQADIFAWAEQNGFSTGQELLTTAELENADAAWLVSSVRHAAPISAVDGRALAVDAPLTAAMNAFLTARVE